jgi:AraC-like DNA-binding protein
MHVRVSEAAYAVGFQSLSQFNRAFHRVTGESPTAFRARSHPGSAPLVLLRGGRAGPPAGSASPPRRKIVV